MKRKSSLAKQVVGLLKIPIPSIPAAPSPLEEVKEESRYIPKVKQIPHLKLYLFNPQQSGLATEEWFQSMNAYCEAESNNYAICDLRQIQQLTMIRKIDAYPLLHVKQNYYAQLQTWMTEMEADGNDHYENLIERSGLYMFSMMRFLPSQI